MRISASRNSQRYTVQGPIRSALELVQPSLLRKHKSKKKELDLKISRGKKIPLLSHLPQNGIVCMVQDTRCICAALASALRLQPLPT